MVFTVGLLKVEWCLSQTAHSRVEGVGRQVTCIGEEKTKRVHLVIQLTIASLSGPPNSMDSFFSALNPLTFSIEITISLITTVYNYFKSQKAKFQPFTCPVYSTVV